MEPIQDPSTQQPLYRDERLFMDLRQQVVILDSETVRLTPTQFRLLALLVEHPGEVVPRATLSVQIRGDARGMSPSLMSFHICGIRTKLGVYGDQYIETAIGVGYRFRPVSPPKGEVRGAL